MSIDYAAYHPKWSLISRLVRFKRAKGRCECCCSEHQKPLRTTGYIVYLATVHLNHDRTDNRFSNLAALCQRCHMRWDHHWHMYNRKYGKEIFYRNGVLFCRENTTIIVPRLKNYPKEQSLFKQDMSRSLRWKTLF